MKSQDNIQWYLVLHICFFVYAICSVLGKKAGDYAFLSISFVVCYGAALICMALYAIIWQQVIKNMPLIAAYANKAATVLWGMFFGKVFYKEEFTLRQILSSLLIVGGIVLFAMSGDIQEEEDCD